MSNNENIIWHQHMVDKSNRQQLLGQKSMVLWFTGLSGSGKSTLAGALEKALQEHGVATMLLDGDNIRTGLNSDLDFTEESRMENIRRLGEVCKLFVDAGIVVLTAFISPFQKDRDAVRGKLGKDEFVEVFIDTPLEICEQRDVKGLYKKARKGEIPNFTGISSPYEAPTEPEVHIRTAEISIEQGVNQLVKVILPKIKQ